MKMLKNKKVLYTLSVLFLLGLLFVLTGFVTSMGIQVNYHEIDKGFDCRIAHITDTHFDDKYNRSDYDTLVDTVNSEEIDVLLFTGDLFQVREVDQTLKENVIGLLSELEADYKLAVLGNHDYFYDNEYMSGSGVRTEVVSILEESGFTVLFNEKVSLSINNETFDFIGLDDLMYGDSNYTEVLSKIDENTNTFVLSHEPDTFTSVLDKEVLAMFSGHSHGGQIRLPLIGDIVNVPGARIYNEHHYSENDKDLYISFGLGESAIRIRFYNKRQFEIYQYS